MRLKLILVTVFFVSLNSEASLNCPVDTANTQPNVVKIVRREAGDTFYCTGTIVQNCFILIAAHCVTTGREKETVSPASSFSIKSGVNSETDLGPITEVLRPLTFQEFERDDVGLLRLASCTQTGEQIEFAPMTSNRDVTVGGYGAIKLMGYNFQPIRRIGPSRIVNFDDDEICTSGGTVALDGSTVSGTSHCIPIGQDSGSPILQNGRIRGVLTGSNQEWNSDGTTVITRSRYANVRGPRVRAFLESALASSPPAANAPAAAGSATSRPASPSRSSN